MNGQERREHWFEQVRLAQRAGGSLADFARSIEVPPRKLYYWCKVLRQGTGVAAKTKAEVPTFTAVRVSERVIGGDGALRLSLPDGAQLQWSSLPSPQWLASFARELSR